MANDRQEWFIKQIFRHGAALHRYLRRFTSGAEDVGYRRPKFTASSASGIDRSRVSRFSSSPVRARTSPQLTVRFPPAPTSKRYEPIEHLTFDLSGDWQHATYSAYNSGTAGGNYTGLTLQRQPRLQFRITPAYEFPMVLPSYYTLDAGAVAEINWV